MDTRSTNSASPGCCEPKATSVNGVTQRTRTGGGGSILGAVTSAVLASACCWLPLLLLAFGASAVGVGAFFEQWRPFMAVVAIAFLGVAFWQVYFRPSPCASGSCHDDACLQDSFSSRGIFPQVMLWVATIAVVGFLLFPRYAGNVAEALYGKPAAVGTAKNNALTTVRFAVEGMTCEACAVTLRADLAKIDGVNAAEVDYATRSAIVETTDPQVAEQVQAAAKRHGYTATLAPDRR